MNTDKPNLLEQSTQQTKGTPSVREQRNWQGLALQLQHAAKTKRASAEEISRIIGGDEQFSDHVIRVARRLYDGAIVIDSVARAIVLIGVERLCQLAESQTMWRLVD